MFNPTNCSAQMKVSLKPCLQIPEIYELGLTRPTVVELRPVFKIKLRLLNPHLEKHIQAFIVLQA